MNKGAAARPGPTPADPSRFTVKREGPPAAPQRPGRKGGRKH